MWTGLLISLFSALCSIFLILTLPPHSGGHNRTIGCLLMWNVYQLVVGWYRSENTFQLGTFSKWGCLAIRDLLLWEIIQSYSKPNFFASPPLLSVKLLLLPKTSLLADTTWQPSWANKGNRAHFLLQSWSDYLANQPDTPSLTCFQCQCIPLSTSTPAETIKLIYCDPKTHYRCK